AASGITSGRNRTDADTNPDTSSRRQRATGRRSGEPTGGTGAHPHNDCIAEQSVQQDQYSQGAGNHVSSPAVPNGQTGTEIERRPANAGNGIDHERATGNHG